MTSLTVTGAGPPRGSNEVIHVPALTPASSEKRLAPEGKEEPRDDGANM